jgi:PTS system galactitol-specific IIB component
LNQQRVKRILVACGTAIATSTLVAVLIKEEMAKRGINVETRQCKATEITSQAQDVDLIVSTTPVPSGLNKPVIQTLAFLTGIGKEDVLNQIEKILKEM